MKTILKRISRIDISEKAKNIWIAVMLLITVLALIGTGTIAFFSGNTPVMNNWFLRSGETAPSTAPITQPTTVPTTPSSYTLVYDLNQSNYAGLDFTGVTAPSPSSANNTTGQFTVAAPTVDSSASVTFLGWATTPTGLPTYQANSTFTATGATTTLYACWKNRYTTYEVHYVLNCAAYGYSDQEATIGVPGAQTYGPTEDPTHTFTAASPDFTNNTSMQAFFQGWAATPGGSVVYTAGSAIALTEKSPSVTLYGVWGDDEIYTLHYVVDPSINKPAFTTTATLPAAPVDDVRQKSKWGTSVTQFQTAGEIEGYTNLTATNNSTWVFIGWTDHPDAFDVNDSSTYIKPGESYTATSKTTTLYGVWKVKEAGQYTLKFDLNNTDEAGNELFALRGGITAPAEIGPQTNNPTFTVPAQNYADQLKVFVGWSRTRSGAVAVSAAGGTFTATTIGTTTLYAVWADSLVAGQVLNVYLKGYTDYTVQNVQNSVIGGNYYAQINRKDNTDVRSVTFGGLQEEQYQTMVATYSMNNRDGSYLTPPVNPTTDAQVQGDKVSGNTCADVSDAQNGNIRMYRIKDEVSGLYDVYILSQNGMAYTNYVSNKTLSGTPYDAYGIFNQLKGLSEINGVEQLNTSMSTNFGFFLAQTALSKENWLSFLNSLDYSSCVHFESMFNGLTSMTNITADELSFVNRMTKCINYGEMFKDCINLSSVNLPQFPDTTIIESIKNMFTGCEMLPTVDLTPLTGANKISNMSGLFSGCKLITAVGRNASYKGEAGKIDLTPLSTWDDNLAVYKKADINSMFDGCTGLTSVDLSIFSGATQITQVQRLFKDCTALASLDVSALKDSTGITNFGFMFQNCTSLQTITGVNLLSGSSVSSTASMFENCSKLTGPLTLGSITMASSNNTATMYRMFYGCSGLTTIDLSGINGTSAVNTLGNAFYDCSKVTTIYVNSTWDNTTAVTTSNSNPSYKPVFGGCSSLIGGNGTALNNTDESVTYARIDASGTPGLLTQK